MTVFSSYLQKNLIKPQPANFHQIQKQLSRAARDLKTAKKILKEDAEWAASIAYHAMLRAGRSLLFAYGYLPQGGGQHKTIVELTGKILGQDYSDIVHQFNRFRKKRNLFVYDSEDAGNIYEAEKAIETAALLLGKVKEQIAQQNPQFHLS